MSSLMQVEILDKEKIRTKWYEATEKALRLATVSSYSEFNPYHHPSSLVKISSDDPNRMIRGDALVSNCTAIEFVNKIFTLNLQEYQEIDIKTKQLSEMEKWTETEIKPHIFGKNRHGMDSAEWLIRYKMVGDQGWLISDRDFVSIERFCYLNINKLDKGVKRIGILSSTSVSSGGLEENNKVYSSSKTPNQTSAVRGDNILTFFRFEEFENGDLRIVFLGQTNANGWIATSRAISERPLELELMTKILKKDLKALDTDRNFILAAVKKNYKALECANEELKQDREYILDVVKRNGQTLEFASESLKNDREIVLEAVKRNGISLQHASELLKKDREIVLTAVKETENSLEFADDSLKNDREIILEIVKRNGIALERVNDSLKKDREIVMAAVTENGISLKHANGLLKKDREIVLTAIKQYGYALEHADESLKKDREIVLTAIKQYGYALEHADESLKKDREIVLTAVSQAGLSLTYANESLKKDRDIVLKAVSQSGIVLKYADESLKKDREFIMEVVKTNGSALEYASDKLKTDIIFVNDLSKHNMSAARKFSPHLTQKIENSKNFLAKLSRNILGHYSQHFCEEQDLYHFIDQPNRIPKSKSALFNFNATYSSEFVEKLVIFQILKNLKPSESFITAENIQETPNYYFICFKLEKFLQENSPPPLTNMKELKKTVEILAQRFETSSYSQKETNQIMLFFTKWLENEKDFHGYKEILYKYNELRTFGDLSKIFKALAHYYNYFKEEYDFLSILGYGGEGVAFKVFEKEKRQAMAIKFKYETEESEESSMNTINLLKRNDIEGKIKCFDCGLIHNHLYSVMELGEESLSDYILRNTENGVYGNMTKEKLIEILDIFNKILTSVKSIHDHNILHRDLDPQNIVKVKKKYKIIDFEASKVVRTGNSITIARGKASYMSPEVSHDNYSDDLLKIDDDLKLAHNIGNITIACDVFSLGCILLKLLTNCPLQLNEKFVNDSVTSNYKDDFIYFTGYGKYFYTVVTTTEGEMKLQHAIEKSINKSIDTKFGVNEYLIKCIVTMIQRDSSKRLDCYSHKRALEGVLKILNGEFKDKLDIEKDFKEMKEISSLKSYSQLIEENTELLNANNNLVKENNNLLNEKNNLLERVKVQDKKTTRDRIVWGLSLVICILIVKFLL